jgi:hypothetical protein
LLAGANLATLASARLHRGQMVETLLADCVLLTS